MKHILSMLLRILPKINSVRFGSLILPTSGLTDYLCNTVRAVFYEAEFTKFLGYGGSATLLNFDGLEIIALTRHQASLNRYGTPNSDIIGSIRISRLENGILKNIPFNEIVFANSKSGKEPEDIICLKAIKMQKESPYYFKIYDVNKFKYLTSVMVGYPTMPDIMDYDKQHAKVYPAIKDCRKKESGRLKLEGVASYTYVDNGKFPIDGFSGGAVFSLVEANNGLEIVFEGIIVRAGNGIVHIVKREILRNIVKSFSQK